MRITMRPSLGNRRFNAVMMLFDALIAAGFLIASILVFVKGHVGGGFFLLGLSLIFAIMSQLLSPRRIDRIPDARVRRSRDRLNALFSFLRIHWAVDPEWEERRGRTGK